MKSRRLLWLLALPLFAYLIGCTGGDGDEPELPAGVELIRAEVARAEPAGVEGEAVGGLVEGNNRFAFDLYHRLAGDGAQNLIFSPYSISQAFSMVYGGTEGQTAAQMAAVLHLLPPETHHQAFNAQEQHLAGLDEGAGALSGRGGNDEFGDPFQLHSANAVWIQDGFPLQDAYLELLAEQYGASLWQVDFAGEEETAREAINNWVAQATGGRIEELAPPLQLSAATRLVLANAIYFKASWLFPFGEEETGDGGFTLLDGTTVTAPLMHGRPRVPYYQGDDFQAVQLPYAGRNTEMLVVLPAEGKWQAVEERLSAAFVAGIRQRAEAHDVTLTMPRFTFDNTVLLRDTLQEMGLTLPFSPEEADFGGMVEGGGLFIGDAVHKGTITVDEQGTEAAAVTGIEMEVMEYPRAEMMLDRPFIYAIVEQETGAILFLGRVLNPAG